MELDKSEIKSKFLKVSIHGCAAQGNKASVIQGLFGLANFYVWLPCAIRAEGLHRALEGRPGHYPRQPGQGGNAAAVTSLYWVRTRPSTSAI